jgi:hypothetical protein
MLSTSKLVLHKQDALLVEKFAQNGIWKELHTVAKGMPFVLEIRGEDINMTRVKFDAKLVYDLRSEEDTEEEKFVDFVKHEPLEHRTHISSDGTSATIECRIKVLSSQHDNMFFRIKVMATDVENGLVAVVTSHPIKVVSKANTVKRKQAAAASGQPMPKKERVSTSMPVTPPSPVTTGQEQILDSLARLEQQSQESQQMLKRLLSCNHQFSSPLELPLEGDQAQFAFSSSAPVPMGEDFDAAFRAFITSFNRIPPTQKAHKVRKALANVSAADEASLNEFVDLVLAENITTRRQASTSNVGTSFPTLSEFSLLDTNNMNSSPMHSLDTPGIETVSNSNGTHVPLLSPNVSGSSQNNYDSGREFIRSSAGTTTSDAYLRNPSRLDLHTDFDRR